MKNLDEMNQDELNSEYSLNEEAITNYMSLIEDYGNTSELETLRNWNDSLNCLKERNNQLKTRIEEIPRIRWYKNGKLSP